MNVFVAAIDTWLGHAVFLDTCAKCSLMSQIAVMFECVVVIADFSLVYEHVIHSGQTGIW